MATGTGTQADPRIVFDWPKLIEAINDSNMNYIELGADIYAPDTAVDGYNMESTDSIDGKGHNIYNIYIASGICFNWGVTDYAWNQPIIKDISFLNVFCQGEGLIRIHNYDDYGATISNVVVCGHFMSGYAIHKSNRAYGNYGTFNSVGCNIRTNSSDFTFITDSNYATNRLKCSHSDIKIDYGNTTISENASPIKVGKISNSRMFLNFDTPGNGLSLGNCNNCAILGTGAEMKISSADAITVVEDTLPLDPTSSANAVEVTTAQMKNASYLANLGFPIGVD